MAFERVARVPRPREPRDVYTDPRDDVNEQDLVLCNYRNPRGGNEGRRALRLSTSNW